MDDIVKLPALSRTREEWEPVGRHHGDACVARALRELPKQEWFRYLRAVRAGINELLRLKEGLPEAGYYLGYVAQIDLYLYLARSRRNKHGLRKVG